MTFEFFLGQFLCVRIQLSQYRPVPSLVAGQHKETDMAKQDDDNRSRQLDPEHDAYWQSRGEDERPDDWQDCID